ncbi:hypothetical protein [Streptomyces boncukensis]|uniref:Uncharacterized protein n=1 Tax=Streptomyces boncukensis TaxID=2711219 RepID=A0A6G4WV10_9ACTN|nr:hypothetical protein [Streptomyces boncukensis]NGO69055.1 hypothetical protein [Streptomyces boncukensis]
MPEPHPHWHAFAWNGSSVPPDGQARDPNAAVMPRELTAWFVKPVALHRGAYGTVEDAYRWLERELDGAVTVSGRVPQHELACALKHLKLRQDAYVGLYTSGGILVRALLTCPRTGADARPVRCPGWPSP